MTPTDAAISALSTAQRLLLEPHGLNEAMLLDAIAEMHAHRIDDSDLYFQYSQAESWGMEEGIVKSGSYSIDQGVGVRAISGEKTAFAYSDILSPKALLEAARTTRSIARAGSGPAAVRVAGQQKRLGKGRHLLETSRPPLYSADNPLAALSAEQKVELLQTIDKAARAIDPRVIQVMASLAGEYEVVLVVRSDGRIAADVRPLVRLSVSVIAEQ
ncbi:MAG: metalloprotease TldD, partial [Proteobacteria bacterium]|nr:metalloprotease TldD [Pseudomonadota bacterium]